MITESVSMAMRHVLSQVFDQVEMVPPLNSNDTDHLELLQRQDLGVTFTKIHCWRLTRYEKLVFMDADTFVLRNVDDLFEREELSAAPDPGWPDCFNSGVFVLKPSTVTHRHLLTCAGKAGASFDGGDQGLLNEVFGERWRTNIDLHLPFVYNCVSQAFYSYLPAWRRFQGDVRVVHFIGAMKPWLHAFDTASGRVLGHSGEIAGSSEFCFEYLQMWWVTLLQEARPALRQVQGLTGLPAQIASIPECEVFQVDLAEAVARLSTGQSHKAPVEGQAATGQSFAPSHKGVGSQEAWEHGQIDYRGSDSFDNIMRHIEHVVRTEPPESESTDK